MKDYVTAKPIKTPNVNIKLHKTKSALRRLAKRAALSTVSAKFGTTSASQRNAVPPANPQRPTTLKRKSRRNFVVEKSLDLHGLRKEEALDALMKFFAQCQADNIKNVLVITGGNPLRNCVLRSSFKKWIDDHYFNAHIASYATSGNRHGGKGAFYVVLKGRR